MEFAENLVQFYPNRITVTAPKKRDWQYALEKKAGLHPTVFNLKKKKSSVNLSASSKKEIRDSIFSMYQLSKPRTVKSVNGKFIYNFRQSFVTLTLPSKQVHSDVEIKKCLNHFLTNIRRSFKVENYVWKAELQKNENIHFHLSFDKYIHFQAIRYYWLLAIKPLGYVDAYAAKWSNLTISEYANKRGLSVAEAVNAYSQGVRSKWQSPNCVDASAVTTASSVSRYLSKYFAKHDDNDLDADRTGAFWKVSARSQSLSPFRYAQKLVCADITAFTRQLAARGAPKKVVSDFSTVSCINSRQSVGIHKKLFATKLCSNAHASEQPFP